MILVILGTQDKPFNRLLEAIDKEIARGSIKEDVIVQAGYTKYKSAHMQIFDLIGKEDYLKYVSEADFIISHAGVGSLFDCLSKGKKIIVAPRLKKYGEHTNDHQIEVIKDFADKGLVIPLLKMEDLADCMQKVKTFKPKQYESNTQNIINLIEDYIEGNV